MKKITKIILGTAGGIGAAIVAEAAVIFDLGFRKASFRQMERLLEENAEDPAFYEKIKEGIAWYGRQKVREVSVTAYDGLTLRGHYIENPDAKRTVICFHGFKSHALYDFGTVMRFYYEAGCSLLLTEQRGHLISDGEYVDMGILARHDVLTWTRYANKELGAAGKPVYLSGISMGAATILMASEFELPENVTGMIADCSYSDTWEEVRYFGITRHAFPVDVLMPVVNKLCFFIAGFSLKDAAPKRALKRAKLPILFFHGTADTLVPIRNSYENYAYCAADKKLILVDGAEHIQAYYTEPETYEREVAAFFDEHDAVPEEKS